MQSTEKKQEGPKFHSYIEAQSPEEVLYNVLKDYVDGKLTGDDLIEMGSMYCNEFPPFEYFFKRSGTEDFIQESVSGANSPAEFAKTELFKDIMTSQRVLDRFKKAAPDAFGMGGKDKYPAIWPAGWTVPPAPKQVKGWRNRIKEMLGLN